MDFSKNAFVAVGDNDKRENFENVTLGKCDEIKTGMQVSPPQLGAGKLSPTNPPSLSLAVGNSLHLAVRSDLYNTMPSSNIPLLTIHIVSIFSLSIVPLMILACPINFGYVRNITCWFSEYPWP
nr:hypothetical protein CFP56_49105 [Quercus suber]